MTIATFSLPVDIPWRRIAFSEDMIDRVACDRQLPSRWRSSLAVFDYQPPPDFQRDDGSIVSYLKVACTITGYQDRGPEIQMREWIGRSDWGNSDLTHRLGELAGHYFPCVGAILEVVVAPHANDRRFSLENYPYFADFDPKKREMYEVVTETGETMSRSLEDVKVMRGQTTLQSHEVRDTTTLSGSLSAEYYGVKASGTATNEARTTDLSTQGSENVRTTDAAREARETFSHTTQLSQMYHQLDSYHLGTNRAAFFMLPRPHTLQSPTTFVNGPREIEGIQEFMLVVVRPKEMKDFCVEAYLETAHLTGKPILDWGASQTNLSLKVFAPAGFPGRVTDSQITPVVPGYVVDRERAKGVLGIWTHGDTGGYVLNFAKEDTFDRPDTSSRSDYTFVVNSEQVLVSGWMSAWKSRDDRVPDSPGELDISATVFLKKKVPTTSGYEPGLMITARAVCSCDRIPSAGQIEDAPSLVYEKSLAGPGMKYPNKVDGITILEANHLGAEIKREMLASLSSADRYPRGKVGLLESQLFAGMMGVQLQHADRAANPRVTDLPGIDKKVARRLAAIAPKITRSELLLMPLPEQVQHFQLTFAEAVDLRRLLAPFSAPDQRAPIQQPQMVQVPLLSGMRSHEAMAALVSIGLRYGLATIEDSPLPADTVIGQKPKAGTKIEAEAEVSVLLATGRCIRLPDVKGLGFGEASCRLRDAGLRSEPSVQGRPTPESEVVKQDPPAGTLVTPNSPTTITLKRRPSSHR